MAPGPGALDSPLTCPTSCNNNNVTASPSLGPHPTSTCDDNDDALSSSLPCPHPPCYAPPPTPRPRVDPPHATTMTAPHPHPPRYPPSPTSLPTVTDTLRSHRPPNDDGASFSSSPRPHPPHHTAMMTTMASRPCLRLILTCPVCPSIRDDDGDSPLPQIPTCSDNDEGALS